MYISNISEEKLYRGILHQDGLPLTANELHETSDTVISKSKFLLNNLVGNGAILNKDNPVTYDNLGIRLTSPLAVNLDGDILCIGNSIGVNLIDSSELETTFEGVICLVGWYQELDSRSTIREYGGVRNTVIANDLIDPDLHIQVSKRYQFRWDIAPAKYADSTYSVIVKKRDNTGVVTSGTTTYSDISLSGVTEKSSSDSWVHEGKVYIIPIITYSYNSSTQIFSRVSIVENNLNSNMYLVESASEPTNVPVGTTWYNSVTGEFSTNVRDKGFVKATASLSFIQYKTYYIFPSSVTPAQNITVPVGIETLNDKDSLIVTYEGTTLSQDQNYLIDYANHSIILLNRTANQGDRVDFTMTRLIEAGDVTNISQTILEHIIKTSNAFTLGHVYLSDSTNNSFDASSGIAATPLAVKNAITEAKSIKDDVNTNRYRIGVSNGMLYIESED